MQRAFLGGSVYCCIEPACLGGAADFLWCWVRNGTSLLGGRRTAFHAFLFAEAWSLDGDVQGTSGISDVALGRFPGQRVFG